MTDLSEQGLERLEAAFAADLQWVLEEEAKNHRIPDVILNMMGADWRAALALLSACRQAQANLQEVRELLKEWRDVGGFDEVTEAVVEKTNAFLTRTAPRTIQQQVSDSPTAPREEGETR